MAIEKIEREITALKQMCGVIALEFHRSYTNYLTVLAQAVRQQAIRASYHLCTQGYPDEFLSLSFNQRQQLQQDIRSLVQKATTQLLAVVATPVEVDSDLPVDESQADAIAIRSAEPEELQAWQYQLEQAIAAVLKTLSRELNHLLQQVEILPKKLPSPLLDAALTSEVGEMASSTAPHLLNLLIETENQESSESNVTQIIAIHLRLAEIEFADTTVRAGRNQIRNLEAKARSLFREYHKKQQERAIAEAEAAWRASWYED